MVGNGLQLQLLLVMLILLLLMLLLVPFHSPFLRGCAWVDGRDALKREGGRRKDLAGGAQPSLATDEMGSVSAFDGPFPVVKGKEGLRGGEEGCGGRGGGGNVSSTVRRTLGFPIAY